MPEHRDVWTDPLTPLVFLERTLRVFPTRTAVIHGEERFSYERFAEEVGRMAGALRRAGVAVGDRVAILAPNTPLHLASCFAAPLLRAPLVSINTRLAPAEIEYILGHSGAQVLLVDSELAPLVDGMQGRVAALERVIELPDPCIPLTGAVEAYPEFAADAPVLPIESPLDDEDALLSINYTSGTTGMPKGVMYTHRGASSAVPPMASGSSR